MQVLILNHNINQAQYYPQSGIFRDPQRLAYRDLFASKENMSFDFRLNVHFEEVW
jgi:hypothetical protein